MFSYLEVTVSGSKVLEDFIPFSILGKLLLDIHKLCHSRVGGTPTSSLVSPEFKIWPRSLLC
jgi:hypothetical protein